MKSISEIIAGKQLVHVQPADRVRSAARTMTDNNIGAVAVVDDGTLVGLFSERDLMTRVVAEGKDPDAVPVSEVMTRELAVADPKDSIADCVQKMHALGCRHLPVVTDGKLVGMISLRDLLQVDSQSNRAKASFLRELVTYSRDYES